MSIISNLFSRQVEMYRFTHMSNEYYYTSSDKPVIFLNRTYNPVTIKRSDIISSFDSKAILDINTTRDNEVVKLFRSLTPSSIKITIYQASRDDLTNYKQIYNGLVKTCDISNNQATLKVQSLGSLLLRDIGRQSYQKHCNHKLYSKGCGLDEADYTIVTSINSISENGLILEVNSVSGYEDQYFKNGVVRTNDGQARMIINQVGTTIEIQNVFEYLKNDYVTLSAGCLYTSSICKTKFNNFENYRGFEYIPNRDPLQNGL